MVLIGGFVNKTIMGFLLALDAVIYNFVRWFYDIFLFLARINLFNQDDYINIVNRIYIILGVIMLFVLAYSILKAIINPDEFSKGETSFPNLVKNVIISLIIIVVLPTAFDVAYRIQNAILQSNVIEKIFLSEQYTSADLNDGGNLIAAKTFQAFLRADDTNPDSIMNNDNVFTSGSYSFEDAQNNVEKGESFMIFTEFSKSVDDGKLDYNFILSTIAGLFLLWCILLFCFDLGIRVFKLVFYQVIAPVAVICRIIPGGKTKDVFPTWMKSTLTTFLEVFIRIAIMYLGVYLIILVSNRFEVANAAGTISITDQAKAFGLGPIQRALVLAFLIMGIIAFVRQAPKLIQDIFKLETGGLNLGLKGLSSRLEQGGGYAIGAAGAAGGTEFIRRLAQGHGLKSAIGGLSSGVLRGFKGGLGAKSFSEAKGATSKAIQGAERAREARLRRQARRNSNQYGRLGVWGEDIASYFTGGENKYAREEEFINSYAKNIDDGDAAIDEVYSRNASNVEVQNAYMEKTFNDAQKRWRGYSIKGFDADTIYEDIYGNKRQFTNVTDFNNFMRDFSNQRRELDTLIRNHNALSKEAMESTLEVEESRGFQGARTYTDFFGVQRTINNEQEYHNYIAQLKKQMGDIDRGAKRMIKNAVVEKDNIMLTNMAVNTNEGDSIRLDRAGRSYEIAKDVIHENSDLVESIHGKYAKAGEVFDDKSFSGLSDFKDKTDRRKNDIATDKARIARQKAARDAGKSN